MCKHCMQCMYGQAPGPAGGIGSGEALGSGGHAVICSWSPGPFITIIFVHLLVCLQFALMDPQLGKFSRQRKIVFFSEGKRAPKAKRMGGVRNVERGRIGDVPLRREASGAARTISLQAYFAFPLGEELGFMLRLSFGWLRKTRGRASPPGGRDPWPAPAIFWDKFPRSSRR